MSDFSGFSKNFNIISIILYASPGVIWGLLQRTKHKENVKELWEVISFTAVLMHWKDKVFASRDDWCHMASYVDTNEPGSGTHEVAMKLFTEGQMQLIWECYGY